MLSFWGLMPARADRRWHVAYLTLLTFAVLC